VHPSASAVWPLTGLTLVAFLMLGYRIWPGVFVGAFLVNVTAAGSIATSVGIALGNTLEGALGCYLLMRFAKGREFFERAQDIFKFAFFVAMLSAVASATLGVTSLALGGFADWANYEYIWRTWWLGDTVGDLIVAPALLLWIADWRLHWDRRKVPQAVLLFTALSVLSWAIFGGSFHSEFKNYPLEFVCIPFLIWTAFQFGRRAAATAVLALSGIAIWGTLHGFGPFVRGTNNTSLLLLQSFMGVMAVTTLALGAEVSERMRAEEQVRKLAVMDPLTGLANYRHLLESMEFEIRRYGRTFKPFAVLLLDLDGLKQINDEYGHPVGSKALCRVGNVLRQHCRSMDVPARYGGDEFAVVLPETSIEDAWNVAQRISDLLAADGEQPPLSISVGVAVYPHDGETIEHVLTEADRVLYVNKRASTKKDLQRA